MKLSYEFTPRILEHILSWGNEIYQKDKKHWTKWDAKIYFLVHTEAKKIRHDTYVLQKSAKKRGSISPAEHFQGTMTPGK